MDVEIHPNNSVQGDSRKSPLQHSVESRDAYLHSVLSWR